MKRTWLCVAVLLCLSWLIVPSRPPAGAGAQMMPPHPRLRDAIARGELVPPASAEAMRAGLDGAGGTPRALAGSLNALAVVVDFSDKVKTVTASYFDTLIFAAPVSGRGSVRDYYAEVSYGTVDIVTVNLPSSLGWKRAPQSYAYYTGGNYCLGSWPNNCQKLAEDIVDAVNGAVDFADYDNDGDGYAEPILLIHAGAGAEFTGQKADIWSHSWGLHSPRSYDGVTIADYVIMPEYWTAVSSGASDMTIGVFVHEMGHGFWSLPDVYDRDYSSEGAGSWSLMAGGSWNGPNSGGWGSDGSSPAWPDAWCRTQMGFVVAGSITSNTSGQPIPRAYNNPPPAKTVLKLRSGVLAAAEYFLLENRQQASGSYDEYLPGSGLLIWHVDEAMNVYTKQNDKECTLTPHCQCDDNLHYLLALEQADGLGDLEWGNDRGDGGDPFPGWMNNRTWTMSTDPESSSWYGGPVCTNTCVGVTGVSDSAATMTANLQVSCVPAGEERAYLPYFARSHPAIPPAPALYAIGNADGDGSYTVSWSSSSLASRYELQEDDNSSFTSPTTRCNGPATTFAVSGQPTGTWYYRVRGCSGTGCGAWSNTQSATVSPPGGWQTIVSTDFEGSFPGSWSRYDWSGFDGGEFYWGKRTCRPYDGWYSGWAIGGGAQGANLPCFSSYPNNVYSWMVYGPFSLVGASAAEMSHQLWLDTEFGHDYVWRFASIDGNWFWGEGTTGNTGWTSRTLDLSDVYHLGDLLGQPQVWVVLVFESDSSSSLDEGGHVDKVVVRKYVGGGLSPVAAPQPALPATAREDSGSRSLEPRQVPARHTLYLDNQTGGRACLEVQDAGLGWKCTSPGRALYGSFPAGVYTYCVQACRADECRSATFRQGAWDLDARCTAEGDLDIALLRVAK